MRNSLTQKQKTLRMVQLAMLVALVVVLQIISTLLPVLPGGVSITLTLVPVVIGGILLGKKGGFVLGLAFGLIVMINCATGLDKGAVVLWNENALSTAVICLTKGIAAGFLPAVFYDLIIGKNAEQTVNSKRKFLATLVAALSAPIINTALYLIGMWVLFNDLATSVGVNFIAYALVVFATANFAVEFIINIVLTPAIVRIVDVTKKKIK
ncbi:MAG: ECF transporter S component [Ruminococcaceae bacterium]|nr:ECF transporter S component [Oscillospiraceae bacterium]